MTEKEYLGFTHQQWQTLILFALLVAVMVMAYNIGAYTSMEFGKQIEACKQNPLPDFTENFLNFTTNNLHG